ncbi:hypothetical protein [Nocardia bovistercoris]|uniref:hypothetical protein n=1 Tax=Nocardia bovistercoris TaxID=2785916 RepID=UPI001E632336|nr:hypothetical protein [Nocardia bovistercoris]
MDLLDRHRALQTFIDGTPNHACAAATNPLDQAVMLRDQLTGIDGAYSEPSRNRDIPHIDRLRGPPTSVAGAKPNPRVSSKIFGQGGRVLTTRVTDLCLRTIVTRPTPSP